MKKKETLKTEIEKTIRLLVFTLGVLIVFLVGAFLLSTGKNAELGYRLEQARKINEELKNVSQELKAQVTTASASQEMNDEDKLKEMTPPDELSTKYLLKDDNN